LAGVLAGLFTLPIITACSADPPPGKSEPRAQTAVVPGRPERSPAAAAGGVCQLLDFYAVEQFVGVQFEVAAAAQHDATATCVLQRSTASYPDLMLAITPSTASASAFRTAAPPGATELSQVGQAAYQLVRPGVPGDAASPGSTIEIDWLTQNGQLMMLRYRMPADRPQAEAEAFAPRVVELVRFLNS
jgi:hypothetical protein